MDYGRKRRILMVEDEPDFISTVRLWLEPRYELFAFEKGDGLIETLDALRPDLLILDVWLPGADGFELCREIALEKRFHRLPILFLTACQGASYFAQSVASGGSSYMTKPVSRSELLIRIDELLGRPQQQLIGRGL